jgi:hypothetical protein
MWVKGKGTVWRSTASDDSLADEISAIMGGLQGLDSLVER